jgi:hypothetical protein
VTGKRFRFVYEYDFGDSWRHAILFEGRLALASRSLSRLPSFGIVGLEFERRAVRLLRLASAMSLLHGQQGKLSNPKDGAYATL